MSDFQWRTPKGKDSAIYASRVVGGVKLVMQAENARRENTGLHAKVTIALAEVDSPTARPVVSDTFNTEREESRHDLVNKLYGVKGRREPLFTADFIEVYPRRDFAQDLYDFCEEFYAELVGRSVGGWVAGDSEKTLPEAWIKDILLKEGGTIMFALPGSGKSYTGLLMAQSINAGVCSVFEVEKTIPLYINLERGEKSMGRRLGLVNRALGLPAEHPLLMLNKRGHTLSDVYDIARQMIAENGVKVVFLDSLSRSGVGDMNANEKSNKSMDLLNALCPSWLAIGHSPRPPVGSKIRADEMHVYGSIMFDAAMDIGLAAIPELKDDGTLGVGLMVTKTNDTPHFKPRIVAYEFDQFGLTRVREANRNEFAKIEQITAGKDSAPRTHAERIYDQLMAFGKLTQGELADELRIDTATVSKCLTALMEEKKVGREKSGRTFRYYAVSAVSFEGYN